MCIRDRALTVVAAGTYFIGQKGQRNVVNLKKAENVATTADDKNVEAAQNVVEETTTEGEMCIRDRDKINAGEPLTFDFDGNEVVLEKEDLLIDMAQVEGYVSESDGNVTRCV